MSRGLYAACQNGLVLEGHSGGYRVETLRPDRVVAGRRLVDHPTPQVTLLATLQRVRPAAMARMIDRGTRASGVLPESARIASNRAATVSNSDGLFMNGTVPLPVG